MHSKERVKFRVFSRNGLQPVVVIHRGGYFNSDKFYCLPDEVVTFDVGSQRWCANKRTNIQHCRINRVLLEKNPPLSLVITRSEIKYCGKITDSSFRLCGWCYFPALGGSLPKIYWTNTSKFTGNYFSNGNNSVNLVLPLQIIRNNDDQNSFRSLPIVCAWYTLLLEVFLFKEGDSTLCIVRSRSGDYIN